MSNSKKSLFTFLAGAAIGALAASLLSKSNREKISSELKDKAGKVRDRLKEELDQMASNKSSTQE